MKSYDGNTVIFCYSSCFVPYDCIPLTWSDLWRKPSKVSSMHHQNFLPTTKKVCHKKPTTMKPSGLQLGSSTTQTQLLDANKTNELQIDDKWVSKLCGLKYFVLCPPNPNCNCSQKTLHMGYGIGW